MGDTEARLTCLVTGATSGIGLAAAEQLARAGAHVVVGARTEARGRAACERIAAAADSDRLELAVADLSLQAEVRRLAEDVARRHQRLDVLVNNAGGLVRTRQETADGIERTWAVNHLAPFLLTSLLTDLLVASAPARVVTVASRAHEGARLDLDDVDPQPGEGAVLRGQQQATDRALNDRRRQSHHPCFSCFSCVSCFSRCQTIAAGVSK